MKWVLICVLIVVIMIIARALSEQIIDKYDFYFNLKNFLNNFKLNVTFRQDKVLDFLNNTKCRKQFKLFVEDYKVFLVDGNLDFENLKMLNEEEKQELSDVVKNLGRLNARGEINQTEGFLGLVEARLNQAENDKVKLSPLILKLSFLFALGLAILLI